jgi:hypothetical protein
VRIGLLGEKTPSLLLALARGRRRCWHNKRKLIPNKPILVCVSGPRVVSALFHQNRQSRARVFAAHPPHSTRANSLTPRVHALSIHLVYISIYTDISIIFSFQFRDVYTHLSYSYVIDCKPQNAISASYIHCAAGRFH